MEPSAATPAPEKKPFPTVPAVIVGGVVVVIALVFAGSAVALDGYWSRVLVPGIRVGGVSVAGKTPEAANILLGQAFDQLTKNGLVATKDGRNHTVDLQSFSPNDPDLSRPLILLDLESTMAQARAVGRQGGLPQRAWETLRSTFFRTNLPFVVAVDEAGLAAAFNALPGSGPEQPVVNASLAPQGTNPIRFRVTPSQTGDIYNTTDAVMNVRAMLASGTLQPVVLERTQEQPEVTEAMVEPLLPEAERLVARSPLLLTGPNNTSWTVTPSTIASWLSVAPDGAGATLTVTATATEKFVADIAAELDVPPQDARFRMEDGKVLEFQPAVDGITVDLEATTAHLRTAILSMASTTDIVRSVKPAAVTTESVNALGIKEKLGTGESSYAGSPGNRIKNIRNAVRKLNGLLIAPGETFSLIAALQPFTSAGGYFPELVIKGDKITPEIGGGACQIGTTTFRATMNSGLPVVERRNHSLVVSYYNDPSNNNPGTDATIYEPSPDYKFLNDTGHHVLFEARMDETKQKLYFSFWGTSDGRKGSYSPPKLLRWIGTGPEKIVETTNLPVGKRECQASHPGADTTFTYTVVLPDGTKNEVVFDSHYRALPRICLVGVASPTPQASEGFFLDPSAAADAGAPAQ